MTKRFKTTALTVFSRFLTSSSKLAYFLSENFSSILRKAATLTPAGKKLSIKSSANPTQKSQKRSKVQLF